MKMNRTNKKAIIAAQFNWLFILIIGVIIVIFFFTAARNNEKNSDIELAVNFIKHLDPILSASERSPGTLQKINIPDTKIEFVCEDDYSKLRLADGYEQDMTYDLIFSTGSIKSRTLYTWSLDWNTPYKVTSFLYLTSPDTHYIFINDSPTIRELYANFPKNVSVEMIDSSASVSDAGYERYTVIFNQDTSTITFDSINPDKIFGVQVKPGETNILDSYGKINFFQGNIVASEGTLNYLGTPLVYGAIFSQDKEYYDCTLKKALRQLKISNQLNWYRALNISDELQETHNSCKTLYVSPTTSTYNKIVTGITTSDFREIYEAGQTLRRSNEDLIRGKKCPLLY